MEQIKSTTSIKKLIVAVSASIFIGELAIMLLFDFTRESSKLWIGLVDSLMLVLITLPFVYFFSFRPLSIKLAEIRKAQIELARKNKELEDLNSLAIASESKYLNLFDFAPVGYLVIDSGDKIQEINITGCNLLGISRFNVIDKDIGFFFDAQEKDRWLKSKEIIVNSKFKVEVQMIVTRLDKTSFYSLFECKHEAGDEGDQIRISFTDITEENFPRIR